MSYEHRAPGTLQRESDDGNSKLKNQPNAVDKVDSILESHKNDRFVIKYSVRGIISDNTEINKTQGRSVWR
jgi:hypothetical protein